MNKEHTQIVWNESLATECSKLLELAVWEDTLDAGDWTTRALVPEDVPGRANVVSRETGVVAGLLAVPLILAAIDERLAWTPLSNDGDPVRPAQSLGRIEGPASQMLVAERLVLNFLGKLSGIATITRQYVDRIEGTNARIYDTRKTTPGWRLLEKYAVQCGGGCNHRTGLYDAVLIKDNHLALGEQSALLHHHRFTIAEAVEIARAYAVEHGASYDKAGMIIQVEVDTLEQLEAVLPVHPDIVLLDNMAPDELRRAVAIRDKSGCNAHLEASGGVDLDTIRAIAETGVERISVGRITHSAVALDIGLDWLV